MLVLSPKFFLSCWDIHTHTHIYTHSTTLQLAAFHKVYNVLDISSILTLQRKSRLHRREEREGEREREKERKSYLLFFLILGKMRLIFQCITIKYNKQ